MVDCSLPHMMSLLVLRQIILVLGRLPGSPKVGALPLAIYRDPIPGEPIKTYGFPRERKNEVLLKYSQGAHSMPGFKQTNDRKHFNSRRTSLTANMGFWSFDHISQGKEKGGIFPMSVASVL